MFGLPRAFALALITFASTLAVGSAMAQPTSQISYQGFLEENGSPVEGMKSLTFRLYDDASGGTSVWEETHPAVDVRDGVFVAYLGSIASLRDVAFDRPLYVGMAVSDGPEIGQRIPLSSVPHSQSVRGLRVTGETDAVSPSVAVGWSGNKLGNPGSLPIGATISGGGSPSDDQGVPSPNGVFADFTTIGGGYGNLLDGKNGTIAGGVWNQASGVSTSIGGGATNTADGGYGTIAGGKDNRASGTYTSVGGGINNASSGTFASIAGGANNVANESGAHVAGGVSNTASGQNATVLGGFLNTAGGSSSVAAGAFARVRDATEAGTELGDRGTFVWSDFVTYYDYFESTGSNQFLVRARGGIGFNTNRPNGTVSISRTDEAAEYQLEVRNEGSIRSGQYDGVVFTQGTDGATPLGSLQVLYRNNGNPDLALNLRKPFSNTLQQRLLLLNDGDVAIPATGAQLRFTGTAGGGGEGIGYVDLGRVHRQALQFPGNDLVVLGNRAANGSVSIRANNSTAGSAGETQVADFQDDRVVLLKRVGILNPSPSVALDVNGTARVTNVDLSSDARLKRDVALIEDAGATLERLRGVTYHWRADAYPDRDFEDDLQYGLIAQEVREVLPELVSEDGEGMLSVSYVQLVPLLIEALKEQRAATSDLRAAMGQQQEILQTLQEEVARLSAQLAVH